eukprot:m.122325 g.122325  ORF g.122325 m.122325 type:complete len:200 (+) comp9625_c0_seq8:2318-2917(+)
MGDRRVVQVHNRLTTTMSGLGQSLLAASQAHREATGEEANLVRVVIAARLSEKLASVEKLGANLHDFATSQSEQTTGLLLFYPKAALLVFEVNDDHAVALIKHVAICEARGDLENAKVLLAALTPQRAFSAFGFHVLNISSKSSEYKTSDALEAVVCRTTPRERVGGMLSAATDCGLAGRRLPAVGSQDRPVPPSPIHE